MAATAACDDEPLHGVLAGGVEVAGGDGLVAGGGGACDERAAPVARGAELTDRTTQLAELADDALCSRAPITDGERLVFAPGAETEQRSRDALAAEASCCSFLRMDLRSEPEALVLDITGPAQAKPIIVELFA